MLFALASAIFLLHLRDTRTGFHYQPLSKRCCDLPQRTSLPLGTEHLMASLPAHPLTQTPNTSSTSRHNISHTTPASATSSNNTFLMPGSPIRQRKAQAESYRPQIITTVGARPACLVNASVTYVGNDQIYAFGGFDQYTDEGW